MLQIQHLNKRYGDRPVLQDLNLSIHAGEIYGLLGPNGAGKTTTINIICNLLQADSGVVKVGGRTVSEVTKKLIGVAPQENLLYRSLTCAENLNFFAQIYGLSRTQRRQQVQDCLEAVNLSDRANSPAETLSGGMQRRLSMAIALVHRPKLVILDEPTTGLDIEARYEIWELIRQLKGQGITVLLTTHLLDEAERLCQRIGILKGGQLMAEGTLEELQQSIPAKEVVVVQTDQEEEAIARARESGFTPRRYGSDLAFWLPESLELQEILDRFAGIPLESVSRYPVKLEHIYLEITQPERNQEFFIPEEIPDPWVV
ncbi:ABC transporter ATP-binding protein [Leptolyngbya sp. FACHB-671]|uniref:ATP-binding cassette domain-containing protein n=1 Tax=Leptolyngbya sp. FACHB-671 TaxID=2692812 RepID=UPI0016882A6F|nr:ABC transporter ATP-binding protein [Leptolyngbya sp. FACHB-671]